MDSPSPPITAEVVFKEDPLALIHVPLPAYTFFLPQVLQLLLPSDPMQSYSNGYTFDSDSSVHWTRRHAFLNISLTPVECSIVCSRILVNQILEPAVQSLREVLKSDPGISISKEDFLALQIEIEGDIEPDQRIVELTSPLALAGVLAPLFSDLIHPHLYLPGAVVDVSNTHEQHAFRSIFFLTTYFSDYILVPSRARHQVVHALQQRGFTQSSTSSSSFAVKSPQMGSSSGLRPNSAGSTADSPTSVPSTPPPKTVPELEERTFKLLKSHGITPTASTDLHVISCAAKKELVTTTASGGLDQDAYLRLGLLSAFTATPAPRFLSITLTDTEDASLLMEQRLRSLFGPPDVLLGSPSNILVPITLDLRTVPFESTGIVCGISGRIAEQTSGKHAGWGQEAIEIRFLSTARAAAVVVETEQLERAVKALEGAESAMMES